MADEPLSSENRKMAIWRLVRRIPKGFVATYGDIARSLWPPCNPRLVGWALRQAHPAAGLPWHRVLAAGGRIALGGSHALEQRLRLEREGVRFRGRKVRMDLHHYGHLPRASNPPRRMNRRRHC